MTAIQYPMAIYSPEGVMSIVNDDEERAAVESAWSQPEDDGSDEVDARGIVKRGPGRPRKIQ
jgi:hypothetical protein